MIKSTNKSPDKSGPLQQYKRIKFDLNFENYKCFISNKEKLSLSFDCASPQLHCTDQHFQTCKTCSNTLRSRVSDLRIPYYRQVSPLNPCQFCLQFRTRVLLMQYENQQVYTDSTQNTQDKQIEQKQCQSDCSQENQIVKSCLKMLVEETDIQSSPPRSAQNSANLPIPTKSYSQNVSSYSSRTYNPQINNFAIDLNHLEKDGRTTVMIRNIPNKYTQQLLLDLFKKNHRKKFDFFYLPMDYKNNCNVGYAFLNFTNASYIRDFYNDFHNQKWKLFNSEKICHICYARIQGASQLSHHFEPSYRRPVYK